MTHGSRESDILKAATALFSEHGYSATTTQAIAKKANVSEKTLFKYFPTKQELYDKVVHPAIMNFSNDISGKDIHGEEGVRSVIRDLFQEKLDAFNEDPDILKLSLHEVVMNPAFRSNLAEIWGNTYLPVLFPEFNISEKIRERFGEIPEGSITRTMVAMLAGYAFDKIYFRPGRQFDDDSEVEFMLELLFNGINGLKRKKENENGSDN